MDLSKLIEKQTSRGRKTVYYENDNAEIVAKACSVCNEVKTLDAFTTHKVCLGGKASDCKECRRQNKRKWASENKDKVDSHTAKWLQENPGKNAERSLAYAEENRDKMRETTRQWQRENVDKMNAKNNRYKARKIGLPDTLTDDERDSILRKFNGGCALTGSEDFHLDHVIPLASGSGGTTIGNIVPLRSDLNISKSDGNLFTWFETNRERFELSSERFDTLITHLADVNGMSPQQYREYYDDIYVGHKS